MKEFNQEPPDADVQLETSKNVWHRNLYVKTYLGDTVTLGIYHVNVYFYYPANVNMIVFVG